MIRFKDYLKEDKGSRNHHLGIGASFAHILKHAKTHIDVDMDGDVDNLEKFAKPELSGEEQPSATKRELDKYKREKLHTKKGNAFT